MPRQAVQDDAWRACQPLACQFTPALPHSQVLILSSSFWCSRTLGSSYNWTTLAVGKVCVPTHNRACVCACLCASARVSKFLRVWLCVCACSHTFKDDLARLQATARNIKSLHSTRLCIEYFWYSVFWISPFHIHFLNFGHLFFCCTLQFMSYTMHQHI